MWPLRDPWREFFCPLERILFKGIGDDDVALFSEPLDAKKLRLWECHALTDVGLRHLATIFPRLRQLAINACPRITDAGFSDLLERLPDLEHLDVSVYRHITDATLLRLVRMRRLRELHVTCDRSCRPWVRALRDTKQLRSLHIFCRTFEDACFDQLRQLKSLEELYIEVEGPIDELAREAFEELSQALPQCKVLKFKPYSHFEIGLFTPRSFRAGD